MENVIIVSGGTVDTELLKREITAAEGNTFLIACDGGMNALYKTGLAPRLLIGDFDSANEEALAFYDSRADVIRLPREKDLTDTHAAVDYALKNGAECILLLGGTGGRMDHTLGNTALLAHCAERGVCMTILDKRNRVRAVNNSLVIEKSEQYGHYVSVIPYGGPATVSLAGFVYPLSHFELPMFGTLGLSNEISDERGIVTVHAGMTLVVESKDQ